VVVAYAETPIGWRAAALERGLPHVIGATPIAALRALLAVCRDGEDDDAAETVDAYIGRALNMLYQPPTRSGCGRVREGV
jgi:hypothetical protein